MNAMFRWIGMATVMLVASTALPAQDGISRKKQEKIQAQKAKEEKKELARKEKEGRKRHLALQDKSTRKRMKRNSKRADRSGSRQHRDGIPARWFRKD
jgi:Flp pilus assembly protein TadB